MAQLHLGLQTGRGHLSAKLKAAYKLDLRRIGKHYLLAGFQHDGAKDVISPVIVATSQMVTFNPRTDPEPRLFSASSARSC
ncbi:MAG: hypothetical protein ACREH8_14220 [Opitutaceae bacterium]